LRNPEEIARFPKKVQNDLLKLRKEIVAYINQNAESILLLKFLAITNLNLQIKLIDQGHINKDEVEILIDRSVKMNFLGEQTVTVCVETNYGNALTSGSMSGIFSASFSHEKFAHAETECKSTINELSVDTRNPRDVFLVNFSMLDAKILELAKFADLKLLWTRDVTYSFPAFNNPYYR